MLGDHIEFILVSWTFVKTTINGGDVTPSLQCQVAQTHHHVADHKESGLTLGLKKWLKIQVKRTMKTTINERTLPVVVFSETASVHLYSGIHLVE